MLLASIEDLSCSIKPELRRGGEIMVCELRIPVLPKIAVIAAYRPPDDSSSFIPFLSIVHGSQLFFLDISVQGGKVHEVIPM